jgi:FkbM family methyltransferase
MGKYRMLPTLKNLIKRNPLLRSLALPLFNKSIRFRIHEILKTSFKYKLINGGNIKLYPFGQIANEIFYRTFEKQEIEIFQRLIKPGMLMVDVGANIGLYSLIASKILGSSGRVYSYEPSKESYLRFLENIENNHINNVQAINKGLSDSSNADLVLMQDNDCGDAERYIINHSDGENTLKNDTNEIGMGEKISVESLDESLTKFNERKVDFIKIDTEGYEYFVLKGSMNILSQNPDVIILMECTRLGTARAQTTQDAVFNLLEGHDLYPFYWDNKNRCWCNDDEGIMAAGDVWVCNNINQLIFSQ